MENTELELRRIKVILVILGIIVLFGACSISNIEERYESALNESYREYDGDVQGILQSSIQLKNNHFALVKDDEVFVYRFDENEGTLTLVTNHYIDEDFDEE
ncbi:hypothetical protein BACPU_06400 [Bacillus pumilus]|nr:hypothetical protein BACPU_06400 [Bacillus pumilus]